jgi:hypothetical protein
VELRGCRDVEETALRSLLAIELSTLKIAPQGLELRVTCRGTSATMELLAEDGSPAQGLDVELDIVAAGARTRLVALTASELIAKFQSRAQPAEEKPKQPTVKPSPLMPPDHQASSVEDKRATSKRVELSASFSWRRGGTPGTSLLGGALGGEYFMNPASSLALELRAEHGRTRTPLSSIDWTPLTAGVAVLVGGGSGPLHLRAGPGVRAGLLLLDAHADSPNQGRSLSRAWVSAVLRAQVSLDLSPRFAFLAGFDAGYVAWPVHGEVQGGVPLVDANGAWLGGTLGAALVP